MLLAQLAAMGELDSTYGAVVIGAFVSAILFGVTNLQAFVYFQRYPTDRIWNRLAVCWLWVLDAAHLAFCIHMVYWYLVTNFGNPSALPEIVWSFKAQIIMDAIVVISVHTLYTVRLWKLGAADGSQSLFRRIIPVVVSVIVFLGYGAAIILCYEITQFDRYSDLLATKWVTYLPLAAATVIDAVIAASLCYLLEWCRTGSSKIDSTISVLMLYTLNTGIITSLCSLTAIITMAALPTTFAVISVEFMLTKLYVNSFMAMFNARNRLRGHTSLTEDSDIILHPLSLGAASSRTGRKYRCKGAHFSFSPDRSTGRSDLRASVCSARIPAIDVDLGQGLGLGLGLGLGCSFSKVSLNTGQEEGEGDGDPREAKTLSAMSFTHEPALPPRVRRKPVVDLDPADPYTEFRRARTQRPTVYDAFSRRDSAVLGNVDDTWHADLNDHRCVHDDEAMHESYPVVGLAISGEP